jgi:hypothetical protein
MGYIYKIINKVTGDIYIGQTKNFSKRCRQHLLALRKNLHHATYLQRAFNKYGESHFEFSIVEDVSNDELNEREYYYINQLKAKYNSANSPEYYTSKLFKKHSKKKAKLRTLTVLQYDLKGSFIKEWDSVEEIHKKCKVSKSCIRRCCRGQQKSAGGFVFKYKNNIIPYNYVSPYTKEDIHLTRKSSSEKIYEITHPDGKKEVIKGLKQFCESYGLSYKSMIAKLKLKREPYNGWKVKKL